MLVSQAAKLTFSGNVCCGARNSCFLEAFVLWAETNVSWKRLFSGQKLTFSGNVCFQARNSRFLERLFYGQKLTFPEFLS